MSSVCFSRLAADEAQTEAGRWYAVNDGVMGGVSKSGFHVAEGEGRFVGETSLDNGGGFASVRREPEAFERTLASAEGIALRVYGDGRTYQLRLKSHTLGDTSAYRVAFTPDAGEWQTLRFGWGEFEAVHRGKRLVQAPALSPETIYQLGLLIADRQAGAFCLRLSHIEAIA
ncbi:CIA30 family protein [Vreelandella subglaciescola]|jgi:monofunctional biosynthetic peptidoglycan transglycosylase|uniref:Complex I intermediate-associated protein 30 (CIA30) n=1 Tax=Vreelandella subglaciescola TaxID=29571 RepID=A0A1M7G4P2_9GAMM|nr:CIA30 family protein [Halomonas subglaciescola]SHM10917.1 Complex I intermediate-associated protein 30 (CIA30) [Halomonas subglaciescola]